MWGGARTAARAAARGAVVATLVIARNHFALDLHFLAPVRLLLMGRAGPFATHPETSEAATINYLQVFFGSLWGILFFNEIINISFIVGSLLVLLGTIMTTSKIQKKI